MAEITTSTNQATKKSFSKPVNRRSTKVDLTPMVDLGFLLITFFVFTTAMSTPGVMNINETKDGPSTAVKSSGALTILVGKNHELYYYHGILKNQTAYKQINKTNFKELRNLIMNNKKITDPDDFMCIIKCNQNSTFGDDMNLIDEMAICNIHPGHYAEADLDATEAEFINSTF